MDSGDRLPRQVPKFDSSRPGFRKCVRSRLIRSEGATQRQAHCLLTTYLDRQVAIAAANSPGLCSGEPWPAAVPHVP